MYPKFGKSISFGIEGVYTVHENYDINGWYPKNKLSSNHLSTLSFRVLILVLTWFLRWEIISSSSLFIKSIATSENYLRNKLINSIEIILFIGLALPLRALDICKAKAFFLTRYK